jgi:hypothetical protein
MQSGHHTTWAVKLGQERNEIMSTKPPTVGLAESREPLSTQVTPLHHAMLDELNRIGMMKNAVVEQGIEMYYRKVAAAGLIAGDLLPQDQR